MKQKTVTLQEREYHVLNAVKQGANYKYKIYINTPMCRLKTIEATNSLLQKGMLRSEPNRDKSHYKEIFFITENGMQYLKSLESMELKA